MLLHLLQLLVSVNKHKSFFLFGTHRRRRSVIVLVFFQALVIIMPVSPLLLTHRRSSHTHHPTLVTSPAVGSPNKRRPIITTSTSSTSSLTAQNARSGVGPESQHSSKEPLHLVLIGGGHAHVQVIKGLRHLLCHRHDSNNNLRVTLIDSQASASYSGMVPGCLAGRYTVRETQLALPPLARYSNVTWIHNRVVDIDLQHKNVHISNGTILPFDLISLDIGSTSRAWDTTPGAAQYTIPTRPIHKLVERLEEALGQQQQHQQPRKPVVVQLVIVGGGVAGLELALSITARWRRRAGLPVQCTVLDRGPAPLGPEESPAARAALQQVLDDQDIQVIHNGHVVQVHPDWMECQYGPTSAGDAAAVVDKFRIPFTHAVWATGAGSHTLARRMAEQQGLDCDAQGWIRVRPTLQSLSHPFVFAAGDCATIVSSPSKPSPPKAGVYAVRAGPVLLENLTRYVAAMRTATTTTNQPPPQASLVEYHPQDDFLKLITCGDGTALGLRYGLVFRGKWVFDLKNDIDQSFMKLFHISTLLRLQDEEASKSGGQSETRQYDDDDNDNNASLLLRPSEAAVLLLRTDDQVDFRQAKRVLRAIGQDDSYRQSVLEHCSKATSKTTTEAQTLGAVK